MSKVIHVANQTHQVAKSYCQKKGICMSEWVTKLIVQAAVAPVPAPEPSAHPPPLAAAASRTSGAPIPARHASARPRLEHDRKEARRIDCVEKKVQQRYEGGYKSDDELSSVYSAPPFWAQSSHSP